MNEDDALRHLLGELAGSPPVFMGRKEAVMSRIHQRVQRQVAVRGAAAFAAVVALAVGGFTTSQTLMTSGSDRPDSLLTEPTHAPSAEPTHGTEPTHAPSTEPTHPPSSEPTHGTEPTHAPVTTEPTHHEPSATPSPETTAASGPLTLSVSMDPASSTVGTSVYAIVTARDGNGALKKVHIDWRDGTVMDFSPTGDPGCRTTHLDGKFSHTYHSAGTYAPLVTVTSGDACSADETVTKETHETVNGGDSSPSPTPTASCTNGSSTPTASGTQSTGDSAAYVYLHAAGSDSDGVMHLITVDWGDGTTTTVGEWSTGTSHDGNVNHHYSTAGQHTVTIHVKSTDCHGGTVQESSTQVSVNQSAV